jgi:hypothetical protein
MRIPYTRAINVGCSASLGELKVSAPPAVKLTVCFATASTLFDSHFFCRDGRVREPIHTLSNT